MFFENFKIFLKLLDSNSSIIILFKLVSKLPKGCHAILWLWNHALFYISGSFIEHVGLWIDDLLELLLYLLFLFVGLNFESEVLEELVNLMLSLLVFFFDITLSCNLLYVSSQSFNYKLV